MADATPTPLPPPPVAATYDDDDDEHHSPPHHAHAAPSAAVDQGGPMMPPNSNTTTISLRPYQVRMVEAATTKGNTIIMLPTGAGKTLIAAEAIRRFLDEPLSPSCAARANEARVKAEEEALLNLPTMPATQRKKLPATFHRDGGKKVLFLVPTLPLIEQQKAALVRWLPKLENRISTLCGSKSLPNAEAFDILVATPSKFRDTQLSAGAESIQWANFGLIVFDEVHHVLKLHPYRLIAHSLKRFREKTIAAASVQSRNMLDDDDDGVSDFTSPSERGAASAAATATPPPHAPEGGVLERLPRVMGLSASLTYAVDSSSVRESINQLCADLCIDDIQTASKDELQQSGYHATAAEAKIDVALNLRAEGTLPPHERESHNMLPLFFKRYADGRCSDLVRDLVGIVCAMEQHVLDHPDLKARFDDGPPMQRAVAKWGEYVHKTANNVKKNFNQVATAVDAVTLGDMLLSFEDWLEALRIIVISWEDLAVEAVLFLNMMQRSRQEPPNNTRWPVEVATRIQRFFDDHLWETATRAHDDDDQGLIDDAICCREQARVVKERVFRKSPRVTHLKEVLLTKWSEDFHGILFVQQKVMVHVLNFIITEDPDLCGKIKPVALHSANSSVTPTLRFTKTDVSDRITLFGQRACNLLITTDVAEEGLDIAQANCVIRFDPLINSVSLVQGRGRARQENSEFVVLAERADRPVRHLEQVEHLQHEIVKNFEPTAAKEDTGRKLQQIRDRTAANRGMLVPEIAGKVGYLQTYNQFCQKTHVEPTIRDKQVGEQDYECTVTYESLLCSETRSATDVGKKNARNAACKLLVTALHETLARTDFSGVPSSPSSSSWSGVSPLSSATASSNPRTGATGLPSCITCGLAPPAAKPTNNGSA